MSVHGYAPYKPKPDAAYWIQCTNEVLEEYRDEWPLTVRQLFYRLVAVYNYEKTEAAYGKLTGILSRARRAGFVPWEPIRDGGQGDFEDPDYFNSQDHFERSVRKWAEEMKLDRQDGQEQVIELWCEAGGMLPILERAADPYSARVNTGGGYDSVTAKHQLAVRVYQRAKEGLRTVVLHVGDFDGSGEDMAASLRADVHLMAAQLIYSDLEGGPDKEEDPNARGEWAWSFFRVDRVALTAEQVLERNVITAPPKSSDSRSRGFIEKNHWLVEELGTTQISAQLEALTPPELRELLSGAIEDQLDMEIYNEVLEEERPIRESILGWLDGKEE